MKKQTSWIVTPLAVDVGMNNAICLPPEALLLSQAEALEITAALNHFFEACHWQVLTPTRWLLQTQAPWTLHCPSLKAQLSLPMTDCLPEGPDAAKVNAFLTELQMFLKTLPLNQERLASGQLAVNTLHLKPKKKWLFL